MKKIVTIGLVGIMAVASLTGTASAQTKQQASELIKSVPTVKTQLAEKMTLPSKVFEEGTVEVNAEILSQEGIYMKEAELTESTPLEDAKSNVMVNEIEQGYEVYDINDSNYFKSREITKAVNESSTKFGESWDNTQNFITTTEGEEYIIVDGELQIK